MCSCPSSLGIGKHLLGTGSLEHISRLTICLRRRCLLHTQQAKALMLVPLIEILPISMIGQSCNAFLANAYITLVSGCKNTHYFPYNEKKICGDKILFLSLQNK